jgi:aspartyl protease family protein
MRRAHCIAFALLAAAVPAFAADVGLVGVFPGKAAVLVIDGGEPRSVRIGQKLSGVTVISVEREQAIVEIDGNRRSVALGQHYRSEEAADTRQSVVLAADPRGHFIVDGAINGGSMRFLVDTGATAIALPAGDARRLGIDYHKGQRGVTQTANGDAIAYRVRLDRVKVGPIELNSVDAIVIESGLDIALLGMSFLNRLEMRRDGQTMTLIRRF